MTLQVMTADKDTSHKNIDERENNIRLTSCSCLRHRPKARER